VARLETPVSTAVKAPVVAAIEYHYERDGEIVIPAGTKAFGELDQANDRGFVGIRFHSIQLPDQMEARIEGRSMSLEFQPMKGTVTGTNTGKRFLVRSLTPFFCPHGDLSARRGARLRARAAKAVYLSTPIASIPFLSSSFDHGPGGRRYSGSAFIQISQVPGTGTALECSPTL